MVKYDAFKEMGGKLSFSLALLDENNDGILLDSVQSSSGCYSYTKEIRAAMASPIPPGMANPRAAST